MAKYRVGVLFGSRTTEHEVSVVSAMQVIGFLSKRHDMIPIYITRDGTWYTGEKLARIESYKDFNPNDPDLQRVVLTPDTGLQAILDPLPKRALQKPKRLDLDVIFPVFHGLYGEDGTIQGLLELANIPYVGFDVLGSTIGIDKIVTKAVLQANDLPVLDYVWFTRHDWEQDSQAVLDKVNGKFSLPVIIKPARLGSTIGIQRVNPGDDLAYAIDVAIHYDSRILVEPCVQNIQEINCSVLGNEDPIPSVCEQPVSRDELLSYEEKYMHGEGDRGMEGSERIIPAPISEERTLAIQDMAVRVFKACGGLGICRIDFMIDKDTDQVYVNELNTMPGSISFYLWEPSGVSPEELVDRLLDLAFQAHREKRKTTYTFASTLLQQADLLGIKK